MLGDFLLGIVGNLVASYADRQLGKLLDRRINADIQNALYTAWKDAYKDILSTYRQSPEYMRRDEGERGQIQHWTNVLTRPETLDLLFPQLDKGSSPTASSDITDLDTADTTLVTRHLHRQLEAIPEWNELPGGLQSSLRNNLLGGLIFHFGEVIKRDQKARAGLFHQQLVEIRRTTGKTEEQIEELFDYLRDELGQREEVKQYNEKVLNLLDTINQTTQRTDQTTQRTEGKVDELLVVAQGMGEKLDKALTGIVQNLPKTIEALRTIPEPVPDFVGREQEIDDIARVLFNAPATQPAQVAIRGMGGLGKTQLALKVAQKITNTFNGPHLQINLQGASQTSLESEAALRTLITDLGFAQQLPDNLNSLRALYRTLLEGSRAIILADNARDAAQVRPLIPPSGCAFVVTSRQRFMLPGMKPFDPKGLPEDEAEELLLRICPRIGTNAPRLAKLCGYLPLALRISATLLANDEARSVGGYIQKLEDECNRLKNMRDPLDPELDVEASLNLSYEALTPQLQSALQQLSVFPATFDQPAASVVLDVDSATDDDELLNGLRVRSLLEHDAATQRYSLHDLVRVFVSGKLEPADSVAARLRHALFYTRVAALADYLYLQGNENILKGLALFDLERPNVDTALAWARQREIDETTAALLIDFANATVYIGNLRYDKRRERIPQLEAALKAARYAGRKEVAGSTLINLGNAYTALGDARQAINHYTQALAVAHEIGHRQGEGIALMNLGLAYSDLGDARQAIDYYTQALAVIREVGDRRGEGAALTNLGLAYAALGDTRQAIDYYQQRLVIAREIGDRRGEGNALGNLGLAYAALDDAHKAIDYYQQQLVIVHEIGDRRGEGAALGNLGLAYAALGDTRQAIDYYQQQLVIVREIGDRRGEAIASWNLGDELVKLGERERGTDFMQILVDYYREIGHPEADARAAMVQRKRDEGRGSDDDTAATM